MIQLSGFALLLASILAYKLGRWITSKVYFLDHYHIPAPVTGGLICSALLSFSEYFFGLKIQWEFELRDAFLLIFFCTVGLNARVRMLISGGKTLPTLFCVMAVFLVLQNTVGIVTALAINDDPIHGLLAGSISMAGGHGTAISWGTFLESQGFQNATEFGLMAATMGLIMGGLLGGPVTHALIKKHNLSPADADLGVHTEMETIETRRITLCMQQVLKVIMLISACVIAGKWINSYFREVGLIMPDYLPVLMIAIVMINLSEAGGLKFNEQFINLFGDICLELFITMSLMSLNLIQLAQMATPAFIIVMVQSVVICLFAYWIMYRAAGKDYDASLITSGFIGLGLGATPVGLANVQALTERYGPSPKAFLVVPLLARIFHKQAATTIPSS
ncbi:sodium/glutamate symporter [Endozoicomonas montiporae]|uniref:Sodium/glutamate symporter n=1 Tax=Endozoicomonas montiporae CL-33 TaxID=570277 RepID=A0A142BAH1_9GAMM|nr:sodium/glutamate symporter [Endozoicomonas montiporae]AMO55747.1 sodium/glutamate symporter [Endozoicomonas montiporae CL-33]